LNDVKLRLRALGLRTASEGLDDLIAHATKQRWGPVEILEYITQIEEKERSKRSLERRLSFSHIGRFKPMADFDWAWPSRIEREPVESALRLEFLKEHRNIVLVAPQGLGKSMIAQNIAHQAVLAGHSVLFTTAAQLLLDLGAQESSRALDRRLKHYAKASLLVIDEVGYLAFDNRNADLLFQVVSLRYEKKSLILTTNLLFRDWPTIFPNATCATALIDRVVHHADVIPIEGKSYRLREAEEASAARRGDSAGDLAARKKRVA
jgi:DNA replication protein DnaC